jgi:Domain of unknown function (DUF397)
MNETLDRPHYQRSSFCAGGSCVEVAALDSGHIAVRDGKAPDRPPHIFTPIEWDAFVAGVVAGEFDRSTLRCI